MNSAKIKKILIYAGITLLSIVILLWAVNMVLKKITKHGQSVDLPSVKGLTYEEAKKVLEQDGFRCLISDSLFVDDAKKNEVIEQEPEGNSKVKPGRLVYLKVNCLDVPQVEVPQLKEKTLREAMALLSNSGLKQGEIIYRMDEYSNDYVLEQLYHEAPIRPGTKLPKGSIIDLVVSKGKEEPTDSTQPPSDN